MMEFASALMPRFQGEFGGFSPNLVWACPNRLINQTYTRPSTGYVGHFPRLVNPVLLGLWARRTIEILRRCR